MLILLRLRKVRMCDGGCAMVIKFCCQILPPPLSLPSILTQQFIAVKQRFHIVIYERNTSDVVIRLIEINGKQIYAVAFWVFDIIQLPLFNQ